MIRPPLAVSLIYCSLLFAARSLASNSSASPSSPSTPVDYVNPSVSTPASKTADQHCDFGFTLFDEWASFREPNTCPECERPIKASEAVTESASKETILLSASETAIVVKPSETAEPFISFEDWKKIKQAEEEEREYQEEEKSAKTIALEESSTSPEFAQSPTEIASERTGSNGSPASSNSSQGISSQPSSKAETTVTTSHSSSQLPSASPPPHHNRYNYASPDCSARIHSSSSLTQHASSLLHKSRDRYMLTPCKAKEHWVVVELCDEIRIEAVEIAVWEFFSGVVREVRVSVGGEDDEEFEDDPADDVSGRSVKWKEVGSFVGRNVRGVQTFSLPQATSFHRFVRLDFPSFYGSEYYCPVSQLKVYGMNQMEAFKWEQKRINVASKGKNEAKEKDHEERRAKERAEKEKKERDEKDEQHQREKELDALEKLLHEQAGRLVPDILSETAILSKIERSVDSTRSETASRATATNTKSYPSNATNLTAQITKGASDITTSSTAQSTFSRSSPPRSDSSESIYAFIIRRLNDLEGNSTLVARYIEEQAKVMRQMLTRVEKGWEDWKGDDQGRWDQEEDRLGRVISQLEQQRSAFEEERRTLQSQLRELVDELGYERRRGLAQLFVMFIIIILGVISRSSTIDAVLKPLLAEARRRRSIYGRKSFSGPLAGLRIDMGAGRPPAVIGQERSDSKNNRREGDSPTPVSAKTRSLGRNNSISRRPGTPTASRQRRLPPGVLTSNYRSVSAADPYQLLSSSPIHSSASPNHLTNPKPRAALAARLGGGGLPKKMARSAHLHTIDGDRRNENTARNLSSSPNTGVNTPKRPRSSQLFHDESISPPINDISPFTESGEEKLAEPLTIEDGPSDWGTDVETEASVSEIEDDIAPRTNSIADEMVMELTDIWRGGK
ncbi:uncharacterized protein IL334_003481 [Kwoniella shivajii]|uniref:SUN domain-containing protein n=1 Tax=Kwoniella shivajii TaxID=564305 RepID=A0ABZ1D1S2_9TREE|nr:hypothetical protein IL334_003481 [Kwoniella shivajii]